LLKKGEAVKRKLEAAKKERKGCKKERREQVLRPGKRQNSAVDNFNNEQTSDYDDDDNDDNDNKIESPGQQQQNTKMIPQWKVAINVVCASIRMKRIWLKRQVLSGSSVPASGRSMKTVSQKHSQINMVESLYLSILYLVIVV